MDRKHSKVKNRKLLFSWLVSDFEILLDFLLGDREEALDFAKGIWALILK